MYNAQQAAAMQQEAVKLNLKYPAIFLTMKPSVLAGIANGYGPDRWPRNMRKVLSWFFRHYPVPAAIHDVRYEYSDGHDLSRRAADAEFAANLLLVWQQRYGIWRFFFFIAWYDRLKIALAIRMTGEFGCAAWREAWHKRKYTEYCGE